MTSSMLAGERKWASSRRGGMTVLGKVAVPKPINLPSQKLENHGLDPNVEIVPKGSLSWGSRPSSSTSNPWGTSVGSPNADRTTVSPHHSSGRPTSGGGLSRPSTAGSDRHEPSATTWGPNSRPSSASGVLTSNQSSLASSRPLSAEARPGSSHLSRFAEPVYDSSVAWGPNGAADKLSIPSKASDFSLSSGDFPTLGSEKDNTTKSEEPHDHGSRVRPSSGSGRNAPVKDRNEMAHDDHNSGTVDTWTRDSSPHFDDVVRPNADKWQGDPHQYVNSNIPPQHYDAWAGPPMNAPPSVWYNRGPPPAGPPYPHVPHGGFPMEPYPYYRPHPPPLANSQSGPPPGPGSRGHHPRNRDFYRPQMPDAFIHPGMPIRPGFYPGPVPYDGYYGPPMGYNPNDRDMPYMGMPPGPHGPPFYNMRPPQNPSELNDPHLRGGVRGPVGNMYPSEQLDSLSLEESESRGPYRVLKKHENERNADMEENSWEENIEKSDHLRQPSSHKNERGTDIRRNEDMSSRRNTSSNQGYPSDPVIVHSSQGPHKSKEDPKDSTLIQKIEDLNAKVRASDIRGDTEQTNKLLINPKGNSTIAFGSISTTGDLPHPSDKSRQAPHGVRNRADHHNKGRLNQDTGESLTQMVDPADGQAQRARMRELAKQRAIELQKEEEERIKEQKAKALAKLEELNRRTLATSDGTLATSDGTIQAEEKNITSVPEQKDVDRSQKPTEPVVTQSEISQQDPVDQSLDSKQSESESKTGNDVGVNRQKCASHRQKQSVQVVESSGDKSTVSGTGGEGIKNPGSNVTVSGEAESTQQKKRSNKSSKNKNRLDDASASREVDPVKSGSSQLDLNPTDHKDAKQPNLDHHKPQQSRRMPRNQQASKFHVGDVAVWAPVRAQNKEEPMKDAGPLPEKPMNLGQANVKSKRAEMERYVPKPVAKELAQQGSVIPLEDMPAVHAVPMVSNVGPTMESKSGDNNNNKQMKPQRNKDFQQDSKKVPQKSTSQHEEPISVTTETNVVHEWDPSDGWFMPDEIPPTEIPPVMKDEGGLTGKGKKPSYKGQRSTVKNHKESSAEPEVDQTVDQTDRPVSSKENRSHWQRKDGWSGGGQHANSDFKREFRRFSPQDEPAHDEHHVSTAFRKYGGQHNALTGQDDKRKHNYQQHINREKPRQNVHYEYQPVGSNNNNNSNKSGHLDGPADAGPRFKERGPGQSRRGGGNFYGRQ